MENVFEFTGCQDTFKIGYQLALKNPNQLFGFLKDWTGEKYEKLYKFNIEKFVFEEV